MDAFSTTLNTVIKALTRLRNEEPADFAPAVARIIECNGKVIVAGVGKSGHIGRKISATLASTGTSSLFVHPTEASHGDLGMIGADDICILISNSGETAELGDMIYYCKRFSIPLIGISSHAGSTLMRSADYQLLMPDAPEACPIGMAPMTSTTLTLAMGDALAAALMIERGFQDRDFGVFHPGGKLGAQVQYVSDLMHGGDAVPLVDRDMPMNEVVLVMTQKGFGISGVVDGDGQLVGVISDGDLRRKIDQLFEHRAGDIMNPAPLTVTGDTLAATALAVLNENAISSLMVVDDAGAPVGILHMHDLLRGGVA